MSEPLARLLQVEMPYGKYKGTLIADLPGNYLNWFAREGFPAGECEPLSSPVRARTSPRDARYSATTASRLAVPLKERTGLYEVDQGFTPAWR
ncbi:MAG: hypothetical protein EOO30_04515 [Comamonadaceae bacterium]|nr:MAG: hypothetical protein EOO30_04515 [Comamonadaceae bacterium]